MRIVWICGLPEAVRQRLGGNALTPHPSAAWSWILGHFPPPAGVDLHVIAPVLFLRKQRMDFELEGVHWHLFRLRRFESLFLWLRMCRNLKAFIRTLNPAIIHGWGGETGYGLLATYLRPHRSVVSVQGVLREYYRLISTMKGRWFSRKLSLFSEWLTYKRAGTILAEGEYSGSLIRIHFGLITRTVFHPLRTAFLQQTVTPDVLHRQIVFVGGLIERKGALDALQAFIGSGLTDWRLVFIGEGPLLSQMTDIVARHHAADRIVFRQKVPAEEIAEVMRASSAFLLPTYADTGPTALKEALAMGLYPICYDNTGPAELIGRYGYGVLVATADVPALTKAITDLPGIFQRTPPTLIKVAVKIRHDLSREVVWKNLLSIYKSVDV